MMMHLIPLPSQLTNISKHSSTRKYVIDDDDAAQRCIYMCGIVALKHCADFSLSSQVVQLQFKVGRPNFSFASIPSKNMCQYVSKVRLTQGQQHV